MSNFTEYYKKYYEENSYTMEQWKHSSRVAYLKEYIKRFTPKGGFILDVGCGDMYLSEQLPEYEWIGIDINTDKAKGIAICQDLEKPPYPLTPGAYDTVICSETLEHVFDPVVVTKEIRRVIKPTGTYILSTPNYHWIDHFLQQFQQVTFDLTKPWTKEHIHQYTPKSHEEILRAGGFEPTEYMGADAHYSPFFVEARTVLQAFIQKYTNLKDPDLTVTDQLLGAMFTHFNHTIMVVAKPV